jgi:hypothetical protein
MKPLMEFPLNEIEKFPLWANRCITKYVATENFYTVFQVSHAIMIFDALWSSGIATDDEWLKSFAIDALHILAKIDSSEDEITRLNLDNEMLAILLLIKEYFLINDCPDPNNSLIDITKIWKKPAENAGFYFQNLNHLQEYLRS